MSKTVYRVEIDNGMPIGDGPYNGSIYLSSFEREILDMMEQEHSPENWSVSGYRPGLCSDYSAAPVWSVEYLQQKKYIREGASCCPTIEDLKWWFEGYLEYLLEMGFCVVEYEVSTLLEGRSGKQVLIHEDDILNSRQIKL